MAQRRPVFVTVDFDGEVLAADERSLQISGPFGVPGSFPPTTLPKSQIEWIEYARPGDSGRVDRVAVDVEVRLHKWVTALRMAHWLAKKEGLAR